MKEDWISTSIKRPNQEDADSQGNILVQLYWGIDPSTRELIEDERELSIESLSFKLSKKETGALHWKHTQGWWNRREVYEREVIQIAGVNSTLFALASDGSLWMNNEDSWEPLEGLPQGVRLKD